MEDTLTNIVLSVPAWLNVASLVLTGVVFLGTAVAHLTKTPKDNRFFEKLRVFAVKLVKFLPTLGVNPQTKQLLDALNKK
jgi:hypothetical protein